ncbi:MAG TPA: lysylphosphatidylglycerol synthase domain-containing protein, partial [Longimicrobiales bacterium]|nr:lysylphosphatidylglycerol synthase domain-containing protein [Longimicrobiales bacterium]
RRWGIRVLQLFLTGVVTWFIVDRVGLTAGDLGDLDRRWLRPSWGLFAGASGVLLAGFGASALLWERMVRELGGPRLGPLEACRIYFTSNLGRYVPGKVWQMAGLAYLASRAGVRASRATAAAILGQASSIGGATLLGAWALAGSARPLGGWGPWLAGGITALLLVGTLPPLFRPMIGLWLRLGRDADPGEVEAGPLFGLRWILLFAGNWILYAASFALLARSFGVPGGAVELGASFAAAYVLGYLMVFAPAGIGVREGFLVAFLLPVTGAGPAAALAVVARLWMTVLELVPAVALAGAGVAGAGRRGG